MENSEYERMFQLEDSHAWYAGLRDIVLHFVMIHDSPPHQSALLLDAGCGTGGFLCILERDHRMSAIGIDISSKALSLCQKRGLRHLMKASVCNLPFRDGVFDIVFSLDVLYHRRVENDLKTLSEFKRVLRPGGQLIMNLPALEFLKSSHDRAIHTQCRYTKIDIIKKLNMAGFLVKKVSYWNTVLFPFIALKRLFGRYLYRRERAVSDLVRLPRLFNEVLKMIFKLERLLIQYNMEFPIGLSLFCIGEKPHEDI